MGNSKSKIILAVSSPREAQSLAERLRAEGYAVQTAPDGKRVLELIRVGEADIAVLDTQLPDMSGCEACRQVRSSPECAHIPLVMLRSEGKASAESVLECFRAGADDCLMKPYSEPELVARVSRFLASHEYEVRMRQRQSLLEQRVATQRYEIRRLRDLNREIVAAIPSLIVVLDQDQKIVYANPSFHEKLGLSEPGVQDMYLADLMKNCLPRKDELLAKIRQVAQEKQTGFLRNMLYDPGPGRRKLFLNISITLMSGAERTETLLVFDDVTETARRRDVLAMLRNIAQSIHGSLDLDRVLFTILTCATAGVAIGFSRAFLFLINEERQSLDGEMAVGPTSLHNATQVWADASKRQESLEDLLAAFDAIEDREKMPLREFIRSVRFPLRESREVPVLAVRERRTFLLSNAPADPSVSDDFLDKFKCDSFVVVPMIARNRVLGAVLADNAYIGRAITREQVDLLEAFVGQAALAVDSAESYRDLQDKVEKLAKAYEDLRNVREQAIRTEQLAAIGNMAARVAHEIRNPLVTIGGFARSINRSPDKISRVKSNSWIIVQEVERLERILSNIMNFAKPPSPLFELHNINRIVDETMELLKEELLRHGVTAEKHLDESIPLVMVDAQQIKQVLLNLTQNAISALEGEGKLVVTTEDMPARAAKKPGGFFEIRIADTGRGIPEEFKEKIFTPFFTTKSAGTGLGLAIVKKIVDDHAGTISFHSEVGKGTAFVLHLPVSPMEARTRTQTAEPPDSHSLR